MTSSHELGALLGTWALVDTSGKAQKAQIKAIVFDPENNYRNTALTICGLANNLGAYLFGQPLCSGLKTFQQFMRVKDFMRYAYFDFVTDVMRAELPIE